MFWINDVYDKNNIRIGHFAAGRRESLRGMGINTCTRKSITKSKLRERE